MSHTVLVTGATGKTGRRLIPLLLRRGVTVRAASRTPGLTVAGVEPVHFDWRDRGSYDAARKGTDAIYLVSDVFFFSPDDPAEQVGSLLDGAAGAGVRRVVLLSAYGVDKAPPDDPFRRIELVVEASGIPHTVLRPGAFMQNFSERHWSRWDEEIRDRDEIVLPGGDAKTSWISTEDIAAVAAVALTEDGHDGKAYALMGPERLTMDDVAGQISAAAGRPIRYVESGAERLRELLVAAAALPRFVDPVSEAYTQALTGGLGTLTEDVANLTGRPPVSFGEYAVGAAAAWRRP